jgi:DNA-binding SARP family transcriptional activator
MAAPSLPPVAARLRAGFTSADMQFGILGPLEVRDGDRILAIGGPKPRAVLALLLVHTNETVSAERLAVGIWGEDVAPDAVKTVHVHISRLRKALGGAHALETIGGGYRLHVASGELDAARFEQLAAAGREQLAAGDADGAAVMLRDALALWRGPPLADVAVAPAAAARLEEQRLAALEARVEADLAAGRHPDLVGELQELTTAHPVRERFHGQLMLAL